MSEANPEPIAEITSTAEAERPVRDLTDRELLLAILDRLDSYLPVMRSQSESLNWLTTNTAGLFESMAQMNAAGGPMAMLAQMSGRGNNG